MRSCSDTVLPWTRSGADVPCGVFETTSTSGNLAADDVLNAITNESPYFAVLVLFCRSGAIEPLK